MGCKLLSHYHSANNSRSLTHICAPQVYDQELIISASVFYSGSLYEHNYQALGLLNMTVPLCNQECGDVLIVVRK